MMHSMMKAAWATPPGTADIAYVLVLLPPAITRMLFFIPWFNSFSRNLNGSFFAVEAVLLLLLIDDKRKGKIRAPYGIALALFAIVHLTMFVVGPSAGWHTLVNRLVGL